MKHPAFSLQDLEHRLHFKDLWDFGIQGQNINVAVLDSGIKQDKNNKLLIIEAKDFTSDSDPVGPNWWHGTSVAQGITTIAPAVSVGNFKVISSQSLPSRETICQAIQYCIDQYPKYLLMNLSLYFEPGSCSQTNPCKLCALVNKAVQAGITVVAAAGNLGPQPGSITCPGLAKEAITVVSTWTKKEAEWWDSLGIIGKWWVKESGKLGYIYGTSFSAAWVSGGLALLKSAFPEIHPKELKEAIIDSAYNLPSAPEISGILQCTEALKLILSQFRYEYAQSALYFNAGNEAAQRNGHYLVHELGLALAYIRYQLIANHKYLEALKDLQDIHGWLFPGAMLQYEMPIMQMIELCRERISGSGLKL